MDALYVVDKLVRGVWRELPGECYGTRSVAEAALERLRKPGREYRVREVPTRHVAAMYVDLD